MTNLAADRGQQTKALIDDTRAILSTASLDRAAMDRIRDRLLQIAARKEFWNEADYPSPSGADHWSTGVELKRRLLAVYTDKVPSSPTLKISSSPSLS